MKKYKVYSTLKDVNPAGLEMIVEADSEIQAVNKAVYIWRRRGFYAYKRETVAEEIMNKSYRVEFNTTGFYSGQGIFNVLDETNEIEAETAQEAIELAIEWLEESEPECREYAWRAAERIETEYGVELGEYENWEE